MLRHWLGSPGQTALLLLILALGVAVYFSIRLANRAAVASFQHFTDLVTSGNDWIIQAPAGDLPESVLGELRQRLAGKPVHIIPVLESTATRPPGPGPEAVGSRETLRLLGVDLIGIQNVAREGVASPSSWFGEAASSDEARRPGRRAGEDRGRAESDFWRVLRRQGSVFIGETLARRDGLGVGAGLRLVINERIVELTVAGIIPQRGDQPEVPASLLVVDLPALQQFTGREGWLTRVEFRVEAGPREAERREALRETLEASAVSASGPRWGVLTPAQRREAGAVMTRAFRLNLTILSLIALLVGLYLVVQALDGAVVRRREEIGILRSLGVEERVIRQVWLWEAVLLGLFGGAMGLLLGWIGAQSAVRLVGMTVNALYHATSAGVATLTSGEVVAALGISVLASFAAGWWPARVAARTPPAQMLGRHHGGLEAAWVLHHPGVGLGLLGAGAAGVLLPPVSLAGGGRFALGGYLAALLWVVGGGVLGGRGLAWLAGALRPLGRVAISVRLATSRLARPSGRQVLATAGLTCATAMTAGMIILIGSFDRTMRGWISRTLQADLYVSSAGAQSASTDNRISPATWEALVGHPEVADANVLHACEVSMPGGRKTILAAGDFGYLRRRVDLAWVEAPVGEDAAFDEVATAEEGILRALASESCVERFGWRRGSLVTLPTPSGSRVLRLAGVFADYGNERGSLLIDRRYYTNWFRTTQASSVIVTLRHPERGEEIRSAWLSQFPGLQIFTNGQLRSEVLRIFRQTFAITYALEAAGLAVAVLGLAMTLTSLVLERREELTTLRALGFRHGEMAMAIAVEGLLLAGCGLAVGLMVSLALGWLLIRVINKQTFGWTLQGAVPLVPLVILGGLVLTAAIGVSLVVGRWGARLPAEREE